MCGLVMQSYIHARLWQLGCAVVHAVVRSSFRDTGSELAISDHCTIGVAVFLVTQWRRSARTLVGPAGIQRYPQGPSYTDPPGPACQPVWDKTPQAVC